MQDFGNKLALNSVRYSKIGAKEWGHGMVFLGRMLVMTVACLAIVLAHPVAHLAESEKDTTELAREVLETFGDDAQLDLEHEIMVCGQAERSNADAQHELGALLATGIGTRQSCAEAAYGSNAPPSKAMAARNSGARSPFKATLVRYMPWVRPIATTTW